MPEDGVIVLALCVFVSVSHSWVNKRTHKPEYWHKGQVSRSISRSRSRGQKWSLGNCIDFLAVQTAKEATQEYDTGCFQSVYRFMLYETIVLHSYHPNFVNPHSLTAYQPKVCSRMLKPTQPSVTNFPDITAWATRPMGPAMRGQTGGQTDARKHIISLLCKIWKFSWNEFLHGVSITFLEVDLYSQFKHMH